MYTTCLCFLLTCAFTGGTTSLDNLYQSVAGNGDTCVCINKHLKEESNTEYPEIKGMVELLIEGIPGVKMCLLQV